MPDKRVERIPPLGILAGGRGTRLFGPRGGCKPLVSVGGRPLIDFVLTEASRHGIKRVCAAVNEDDVGLLTVLRNDRRFEEIELVYPAATGTMEAVRALADALGTEDFFISTADVIAPAGVFAQLELRLRSARLAGSEPLAVFLGSRWVHDDDPIWIEADAAGVILRYGKRIRPAPLVFGNLRLCSPGLLTAIATIDHSVVGTDTQLMAAVLAAVPGRFLVTEIARVFDVDDADDIRLAETNLRALDARSK